MPASRPRPPWVRGYLIPFCAGLVHAVLMACAFPPVGLWPLVFVAPLPLVWAVMGEATTTGNPKTGCPCHPKRWWGALRCPVMLAAGVAPLWAYEEVWVVDVSSLGYGPMVAGMAAFTVIWAWIMRRAVARWRRVPMTVLVPVVWTGVEVFRGEVAFDGYPWMLLGHPLIDSNVLALPGAVLGAYFVTFLVTVVVGAILDGARGRVGPAIGGGLLAAAVWAATPLFAPLGLSGAGPVRIAVVQTNLPQDNKNVWRPEERERDFQRFVDLTRQAAAANPRPALIVWPETMFPGSYLDPAAVAEERRAKLVFKESGRATTDIHDRLMELQAQLGIPMLIGAMGVDGLRLTEREDGRIDVHVDAEYNSVFLIEGGRVSATRYDKLKLTLFGEVMPYIQHWPWLQRQMLSFGAHGMEFNLRAGESPRVFDVGTPAGRITVGTPICFEGTASDVNRALALAVPGRPVVLVNLTNDGWFGSFDPARWQHLQSARWRALELGVPVVRAANTGVSCSIDGKGRLLKAGVEGGGGARVDGVLVADVMPAVPRTIEARVGRLFGWVMLALTGAIGAATLIRRPKLGS